MSDARLWSWSFSTLGCGEYDLPQVVDLARRCAIDRVELRRLENTNDLPALFAERYGEPARLREALADTGVAVCSLDASTRLCQPTAADREDLLAFVPWAEALGVRWLRVFDGGGSKHAIDEAEIAAMAETVAWWRERRREGGWAVDIMVETHDGCVRSANLQALQEVVGEPVAVLWDTHHPWHQVGEDLADTWAGLKEQAVHLHIKDSVLDAETRHGYRYVPPGSGRFPFDRLWELLQADAFAGTVSLEWERAWHPSLEELPTVLAVMRERFGW